ncbi:Rho termination factor N-terminal domain-containing protein, partial [Candidatus Hakubella thermalkaliphila]|uniref:Rho termination factor N-terminal domain-containing protein n=1 Tax=Candidatus Hakubella thermalkaliphila TaxID=2754717 RepID=UPI00159415C7
MEKTLERSELEDMLLSELQNVGREIGIPGVSKLTKRDLILAILKEQAETGGLLFRRGILDILPDGYGLLRNNGYLQGEGDIYVSQSQISRFNLRQGDQVTGKV